MNGWIHPARITPPDAKSHLTRLGLTTLASDCVKHLTDGSPNWAERARSAGRAHDELISLIDILALDAVERSMRAQTNTTVDVSGNLYNIEPGKTYLMRSKASFTPELSNRVHEIFQSAGAKVIIFDANDIELLVKKD